MSRTDIPDQPDAPRPELDARPDWQRTYHVCFPVAAVVGTQRWVLRINGFPDHPLWTLFVDGIRRFDLEGSPPGWVLPAADAAAPMDIDLAHEIIQPVAGYEAYGSEIGDPCDDPVCCP
ncbi:hypothetical protein [Nocardia sp. NPDC049149]|uniref:hypothetical protein n=1 Tax=Nocardia sp. NPDC049149 TaxID=3364315 RepID=UPI00371251E0